MKSSLVIAAVALMASGTVLADAAIDLAEAKACLSCHSLDGIAQAPSFRSIANKYREQPDEEGRLVSTVMWGSPTFGGYHWGTTKMPTPAARIAVNQAEATQLVQWILGLK